MTSKFQKLKVSNEELSPRVLKSFIFSHGINLPQGYRLKERYVFDYEFELITFSTGSMIIDDNHYEVKKGDIVFRKPGQFTQGIMPYGCYVACIDMLGNTGKDSITYDFHNEQEYQNYYQNPLLESIPEVFHPIHKENYQYLFDSILKEFISPTNGSELLLKSYALNLIYRLYHDVTDPLINNSIPLSPHYKTIKRVVEHINNNIQNKIALSSLAELSNLSPNHFHRVFTQTMDITPNAYITKLRVDKAKDLLVRTSLPISEISIQCGFENIPYFSYVFKKQVSLSPGEFRKRHNYI